MSPLAPGVYLEAGAPSPAAALARALSTPLVIGATERGPEEAVAIRATRDLARQHGDRTSISQDVWDYIDGHFRDGGGPLWLSRRLGPAAAVATATANNSTPTVALNFKAKSKGAWGNRIKRQIVAGTASNFVVVILFDKTGAGTTFTEVERSGDLATGADAVAWSTGSKYVDITIGAGGGVPVVVAAAAFTGGADDLGSVTTTQTVEAAKRIVIGRGPGHYVVPGNTDTATQIALAELCETQLTRMVCADAPVTTSKSTLVAHAATLRSSGVGSFIDLLGPRVSGPGITAGGTRTFPASFVRTAAQARNDSAGLSPNQVAAGRWGTSGYATDVTAAWGDEDRGELNAAGVNVVLVDDARVVIMGSRTCADPEDDPAGVWLGSGRLRMAIAEICRVEGKAVTFAEWSATSGGALAANIRGAVAEFAPSLYRLDLSVQLVDGEDPGTSILETGVEFEPVEGAEVVRFVINRTVKEG